MSRLKRVLLTALAEHGVELPMPSATAVRNSDVPILDDLRTRVADTPAVRMVNQEIVRQGFYLCSKPSTVDSHGPVTGLSRRGLSAP
jgi:hypothetical protein